MNLKKCYKTPKLTIVLSSVDCLSMSVTTYDNDIADKDWDTLDAQVNS